MNRWKTLAGSALFLGTVCGLALSARAGAPPAPRIPVVIINEESISDLSDAERNIERKQYREAVEIYQRLLDQANAGLVTTDDKRLKAAARSVAQQKLAALPSEAIAVYRAIYEPQAKALYEKAMAGADPELLYEAARKYFPAEHGRKAMAALASNCFDRGQYPLAAFYWRRLLEAPDAGLPREELLARLAAACHLGGEEPAARAAAAELKAKYPQAKAKIGGREQNLAEFAASALAMPTAIGPGGGKEWHGMGAVPGGMTVMEEAPASLAPLWTEGNSASMAASQPAARRFLAMGEWLRYLDKLTLRGGQVVYPTYAEIPIPAMLHLASAGEVLLCRDDDGLAALDPATGRALWRAELPLVRRVPEVEAMLVPKVMRPAQTLRFPATSIVRDGNKVEIPEQVLERPERKIVPFFRYGATAFCDPLRQAPTLGDGKAFLVGGFNPESLFLNQIIEQEPNLAAKLADDSCLAAVSLGERGKVLWTVGQGQGGEEVLRKGKFLSAPAYRDGRLYTIALYQGQYSLLCLDARDGSLVWKSSVIAGGTTEVTAMGGGELHMPIPDRTAPPTLVGDRAYVLTTGAVGAYDVRTGEPVWAYEYPIERQRRGAEPAIGRPRFNVSPLIVAGERVICLPPDSHAVMAFSAAGGELLWQKDRGGHQDLSAVDANTVLLTGFDPGDKAANPVPNQLDEYKKLEAELAKEEGKNQAALAMIRKQIQQLEAAAKAASQPASGPPSMVLLDAGSGEVVWRAPAECRVVGRPAVTPTQVHASGFGKIYRLRLSDRSLTTVEVKDPAAVLGNLMTWRGRVFAANACGITAYGAK